MKKPQRRYQTEQEIIAEIDAARKKALQYNVIAENDEARAQTAIKECDKLANQALNEPDEAKQTELWRESKNKNNEFYRFRQSAIKARRSARTLEETTLPNLKRTLAAFNTVPMAFCGTDHAVVLEK